MEHKNTTLMSVNKHLVKSSAGCSVPLALVLCRGDRLAIFMLHKIRPRDGGGWAVHLRDATTQRLGWVVRESN